MLKVYIKLRALKETKSGWKKGEYFEMVNDIFDKRNGFAFWQLDQEWEVVKMEIKEYKPINIG